MAEPGAAGVPAMVEQPAQPLQQDRGEPVNNNFALENPVLRGEGAYRKLPGDRYSLKAPVFTSNEVVEQFIKEFIDVVEVTQWPPHVALLKLRMALAEKAIPYGLGPDINSIFAAQRPQFGISPIDAQVRLQGLWLHQLHGYTASANCV